jgi:signal transduction histidine kinase
MLRVYDGLAQHHDYRLALLAAVVCAVAASTALSLFAHVGAAQGRRARAAWLAGAAVVTGLGIWATHFIAMLAVDARMPVSYDLWLTALSIAVAILGSGIGFALASLAHGPRAAGAWIGGAIVGITIFAMHFIGMAALRVPARIDYDAGLVMASLMVGVALGAIALTVARRGRGLRGRMVAALWLTLAICGLHFTAMRSATLTRAPMLIVMDDSMATEMMAIAVAGAVLLIAGIALVAAIVDQRVAGRMAQEAERLRHTVAELERTRAELEQTGAGLRRALDAAAAGSQAKSQFLASMSHELRTPLNAVIGFADVMAAEIYGALTDKQRDCVADIRRAGTHLLGLVNDVLDVTRLDANAVALDDDELDLAVIVNDAVALVAVRAREAGIAVALEVPADLPALRADARRLRQVLVNLLSNAVKFTPAGGTVTVRVADRPDGMEITVADTGIGMAPEDIPIALERFGQIDSRLARKYEGAGLGLPLSKRLVELHGGTLAIESQVDAGTTVTVRFPPERVVRRRAAA